MKKIVSILLVMIFLSSNISFASMEICGENTEYNNITQNCITNDVGGTIQVQITDKTQAEMNQEQCGGVGTYNVGTNSCEGTGTNNTSNDGTSPSVMGISCSPEQLTNGQCKLNIYDTLGIRRSGTNPGDATSVGLFVQDVVLSATFFIGTLVTIALVVSGLMYIFAAASGKDPADAKKGIIGSLVGLLIVVSSYVIIRLVQYIARGF